jgi:hypothetical protein
MMKKLFWMLLVVTTFGAFSSSAFAQYDQPQPYIFRWVEDARHSILLPKLNGTFTTLDLKINNYNTTATYTVKKDATVVAVIAPGTTQLPSIYTISQPGTYWISATYPNSNKIYKAAKPIRVYGPGFFNIKFQGNYQVHPYTGERGFCVDGGSSYIDFTVPSGWDSYQWYVDGQPLTGANGNILHVQEEPLTSGVGGYQHTFHCVMSYNGGSLNGSMEFTTKVETSTIVPQGYCQYSRHAQPDSGFVSSENEYAEEYSDSELEAIMAKIKSTN